MAPNSTVCSCLSPGIRQCLGLLTAEERRQQAIQRFLDGPSARNGRDVLFPDVRTCTEVVFSADMPTGGYEDPSHTTARDPAVVAEKLRPGSSDSTMSRSSSAASASLPRGAFESLSRPVSRASTTGESLSRPASRPASSSSYDQQTILPTASRPSYRLRLAIPIPDARFHYANLSTNTAQSRRFRDGLRRHCCNRTGVSFRYMPSERALHIDAVLSEQNEHRVAGKKAMAIDRVIGHMNAAANVAREWLWSEFQRQDLL
jgi:hypothetical protein